MSNPIFLGIGLYSFRGKNYNTVEDKEYIYSQF
jgi:hypothetical protein